MNGTLFERFRWWLCKTFGHRGRMHDDANAGDPEICMCCRALLSTNYSRSKEKS